MSSLLVPTWLEFQPVGYQFHQYLRCLTTGLSAAVVTDVEETVSSEDEDSDYVAYLDPSQWKVISMFNNHFIISVLMGLSQRPDLCGIPGFHRLWIPSKTLGISGNSVYSRFR